MMTANVTQGNARGLPEVLRTAQEAIQLPEVQEMLRRLSTYGLGICMPHMHDEQTGQFQPLADDLMQVESGLEVTFRSAQEIANQTDRFLPVAWRWSAGASTPFSACEMVWEELPGEAERYDKHKMSRKISASPPRLASPIRN